MYFISASAPTDKLLFYLCLRWRVLPLDMPYLMAFGFGTEESAKCRIGRGTNPTASPWSREPGTGAEADWIFDRRAKREAEKERAEVLANARAVFYFVFGATCSPNGRRHLLLRRFHSPRLPAPGCRRCCFVFIESSKLIRLSFVLIKSLVNWHYQSGLLTLFFRISRWRLGEQLSIRAIKRLLV